MTRSADVGLPDRLPVAQPHGQHELLAPGALGAPDHVLERLHAHRQPIGRFVTPEEVASAVMLCVDNAAVNGQGITVDGGGVQS